MKYTQGAVIMSNLCSNTGVINFLIQQQSDYLLYVQREDRRCAPPHQRARDTANTSENQPTKEQDWYTLFSAAKEATLNTERIQDIKLSSKRRETLGSCRIAACKEHSHSRLSPESDLTSRLFLDSRINGFIQVFLTF